MRSPRSGEEGRREAKHVGTREHSPVERLRRHVGERSAAGFSISQVSGDAEIGNQDSIAVRIPENVGRLDVAMNDPARAPQSDQGPLAPKYATARSSTNGPDFFKRVATEPSGTYCITR